MVVLAVAVGLLVLGQVAAKLVLADQVIFYQQIQGIIHRSPAYLVIFIFHADIKRFHVKVAAAGIDLFQDGIAFRCFAEALAFQVSGKNLFYLGKFLFV